VEGKIDRGSWSCVAEEALSLKVPEGGFERKREMLECQSEVGNQQRKPVKEGETLVL